MPDPTHVVSVHTTLLGAPNGGTTFEVLSEILVKLPGSEAALAFLVLSSVVSWAVILFKGLQIRTARTQSERFLDAFWEAKRLDVVFQQSEQLNKSPISQVFRAGYIELARLKKQAQDETMLGG